MDDSRTQDINERVSEICALLAQPEASYGYYGAYQHDMALVAELGRLLTARMRPGAPLEEIEGVIIAGDGFDVIAEHAVRRRAIDTWPTLVRGIAGFRLSTASSDAQAERRAMLGAQWPWQAKRNHWRAYEASHAELLPGGCVDQEVVVAQ